MTKLDEVIAAVGKLPPADQERYADEWLAMLQDDARWDETFARSQDVLEAMAAEARREVAEGRAVEMGWDEL